MATHTATQLEAIRTKHGLSLNDNAQASSSRSSGSRSGTSTKPRSHPRWHLVAQHEAELAQGKEIGPPGGLGPNFIPSEMTVRNDATHHFLDTGCGSLPGNAVRNPSLSTRFQEYPKLARLLSLKGEALALKSPSPLYLHTDLRHSLAPIRSVRLATATADSSSAPAPFEGILAHDQLGGLKFDVIMVDAPLEAYEWEDPRGHANSNANGEEQEEAWTWEEIASLPVPVLAAKESFIFLWVGSGAGDGLERGREMLSKWGYRRCEDIVWVQTNPSFSSSSSGRSSSCGVNSASTSSAFARSAQHCLMGIRGTVRRSTDTNFVHCNVDTDVLLYASADARHKPPELMALAEHFCLGTRRLSLFGSNRTVRRGWLSVGRQVGPDAPGWEAALRGKNACAAGLADSGPAPAGYVQCAPEAFERSTWDLLYPTERATGELALRINTLPYDAEVDALRPKSPTPVVRGGANARGNGAGATAQLPRASHERWTTTPSASGAATTLPNGAAGVQAGGGAGLSGLGAGGARTVSIPSGSEFLSGPQATVLLGQATRPGGPAGLGSRGGRSRGSGASTPRRNEAQR